MMIKTKSLFCISSLFSILARALFIFKASTLCESFSGSSSIGNKPRNVALSQRRRYEEGTRTAAAALLLVQKSYHPSLSIVSKQEQSRLLTILAAAKVGIFYGTSTGSTQDVAHLIATEFGSAVADDPVDVEEIKGKVADAFGNYESLVVGTPTWNTGADTERSGTAWDEIYYGEMQKLNLQGKKVAVFGLGDSVSYGENYADASGELHDTFQKLGCNMMGYTSQEGYEHSASKAIRGDQFCGLLCDNVNQEELTQGRVKLWVKQLIAEGFLQEGAAAVASIDVTAKSLAEEVDKREETRVAAADPTPKVSVPKQGILDGYVPHYNPITGVTMWISPDGRTCFYR